MKLAERIVARWIPITISLVAVVLVVARAAGLVPGTFIDRLEFITYDWRVLAGLESRIDPRVIIVDIDEKSLAAEGRWPWSRDLMARLLTQLFDKYHVAVVGFDVVFAEPDTSSGLLQLDQLSKTEFADTPAFAARLEKLRPSLDHDRQFAEVIARYPVVLGYYFNGEVDKAGATRSGTLPPPSLVAGSFQGRRVAVSKANGFGANLEAFQRVALGAGHFNPNLDLDGIVRRVPMLYEFEGGFYESLSIAVCKAALGISELRLHFEEAPWGANRGYAGLEWLELGDYRIPVDENVQSLIPYRSRQGGFRYVSASDILHDKAPTDVFNGRIVLIGTTAPGLFDLRATPVQENYPGVEIHANLITGILDGAIKERPAYVLGAEVVLLLLFGVTLALALPLASPIQATMAYASAAMLLLGVNLLVWSGAGLVLPLASPLAMVTLQFVLQMSYGYFIETRGKRQITSLFGQYVPPELVNEMSRRPEAYSLEAESRELTVLFSDVRGFTSISEGLAPPQLAKLINDFLTPMTRTIHGNRGTIDKYMGDAVMAFWGAPVPDPEHATHAVQTALEMVERAKVLSAEFESRGLPAIAIGVGLNTGNMSVGNMGSQFRMAYTVLGDAVNLGSRLEGLTKEYGVTIIVSESTRKAAPEFVYRELDQVKVKGKDQAVLIYEPLCRSNELTREMKDELKVYKQALEYYRSQNWDLAEMQFLQLVKQSARPGLYKMYAERCGYFREHPPGSDWKGVFAFKTK
jgi:adenylate cyclase